MRFFHDGSAILRDMIPPLPSRSLTAAIENGKVVVRSSNGLVLAALHCGEIQRRDGTAFSNVMDAKAYLDDVFEQQTVVGPAGRLLGTATSPLSGHRVVKMTADGLSYPRIAEPEDADAIVGLTTGAADTGEAVEYQFSGLLIDPSWDWQVGPLFCGDNGVIVQSVPTGSWTRQVGEAISATAISIHLYPAYFQQGA